MIYQRRARTLLGILAVFTFLGSIFAFKAQKVARNGKLYCTNVPGPCPNHTTLTPTTLGGFLSYCTTTNSGPGYSCPNLIRVIEDAN